MEIEKFSRDIRQFYKKRKAKHIDAKLSSLAEHINKEWGVSSDKLTFAELKVISEAVIETETMTLHDDVEELLAQKEQIERSLERKSQALQSAKIEIFSILQEELSSEGSTQQRDLHQIKLQSLDLFDMLSEMVESAILTTLEKAHDIEETTKEIVKEITNETLSEGEMSTIRIRLITKAILEPAIDIAEATPTTADEILRGTLKGVRAGLIKSIHEFKQKLQYMPDELKAPLLQDNINIDDLKQTNLVFSQTIQSLASNSSSTTKELLAKISKEMHLDMDELIFISKEAVEVVKDRFNTATKSALIHSSRALQSEKAQEAKRIGIQAFNAAKTALDGALKTAKDKIDNK